MKKTSLRILLTELAIPLIVGGVSTLLSLPMKEYYLSLNLPSFAPAPFVFGIVWPIMYLLMGYSFYRVRMANPKRSILNGARALYWTQLAVNFFWSLLFFRWKMQTAALWCLVLMVVLVFAMMIYFYLADHPAGYLIIFYEGWLVFALILFYNVWRMNN